MDWRDPETPRALIRRYDVEIEEFMRGDTTEFNESVLTAMVERDDLQNELDFVLSNLPPPPFDEAGAAVRVPRKPSPSHGSAAAAADPES